MTNEVLVLSGVIFSSLLTYLGTTYKFRKDAKPKDPTNELFNYYEQMLKNVWEQSKAKDDLINKLEASLDKIQQELWENKQLLLETKQQLAEATKESFAMQKHITDTRHAMNTPAKEVI